MVYCAELGHYMMRRMRTSNEGLALIKSFEGFRASAVQLPDGGWTIGYGHTKSARKDLQITSEDAETILREYDLPPIETLICNKVLTPLNQNEFDALVSFTFNIGNVAFTGSEVLAFLNSGKRLAAAEAILSWRKAYLNGRLIVVDALMRRRVTEQALFLRDPAGIMIVPSDLIRPVEDTGTQRLREKDQVSGQLDERTLVGINPIAQSSLTLTETSSSASAHADKKSVPVKAEKRLTRILGEEHNPSEQTENPLSASDDGAAAGPTPDEITRAISALANPGGTYESDTKPVPAPDIKEAEDTVLELGKTKLENTVANVPSRDPPPFDSPMTDLPPLPNGEHPDGFETELAAMETTMIDDLEVIQVDPSTLDQSVTASGEGARYNEPQKSHSALYWLIGILGGALSIFGLLAFHLGLAPIEGLEEDMNRYLAISSIVFGAMLVVLAFGLAMRRHKHSPL